MSTNNPPAAKKPKPDTVNLYFVGAWQNKVVVQGLPIPPLTPEHALNLATWLGLIAEGLTSATLREYYDALLSGDDQEQST